VSLLDALIQQPDTGNGRHINHQGIGNIDAKFLQSCGLIIGAPDLLILPAGSDLGPVRNAREDVWQLLQKAKQQDTGPVAEATAVAAALQTAVANLSPSGEPGTRASQLLPQDDRDDVLSAANVFFSKPRPASAQNDGKVSRTVPQSVTMTAAAVGQAAAQRSATQSAAPKSKAGGKCTWLTAPGNAQPESRLSVALPEGEFTYIERPWSHFVIRWAAIDVELERMYGRGDISEVPFSLLDLGSCCGFFSLQAAAGYPRALVAGVEGSVGIGNGTTGVAGTEDEIVETKAIQTHLQWIQKLGLPNCVIAPEVWDYRRVCTLASIGRPICDVLLSLSVIHHIDNVSTQHYTNAGLSHVEGTVSLVAKLLQLSPRHFIELPNRPWIDHVFDAYGSARAFLDAAAQASGRRWSFTGPLCTSEWYGRRELWLLEDFSQQQSSLPWPGFKALFSRVLSSSPEQRRTAPVPSVSSTTTATTHPVHPQLDAGSINTPAARLAQVSPAAQTMQQPARSAWTPEQLPQSTQVLPTARGPLSQQAIGAALLAAPTALIAAHVQLRDAVAAAEGLLHEGRPVQ